MAAVDHDFAVSCEHRLVGGHQGLEALHGLGQAGLNDRFWAAPAASIWPMMTLPTGSPVSLARAKADWMAMLPSSGGGGDLGERAAELANSGAGGSSPDRSNR